MTGTNLLVFDGTEDYPNAEAQRRLASLVGIDDQQERLLKGLLLILDPESLSTWSKTHHNKKVLSIVNFFKERPPLFVLAGDVGTGKTALAESIGDAVARKSGINVTLYRMSLASRGTGLVGEITKLISNAFTEVSIAAKSTRGTSKHRGAHILLVDEADALAQTRESAQMHHEDRAGVNALIRGVDELSSKHLPTAVLMCTNRLGAIDPAIRRRAADILSFERPGEKQRRIILTTALQPAGFSENEIESLVRATGGASQQAGFTYSDLTQRLLPTIVLDAYPDQPITFSRAIEIATNMKATPKFAEDQS
jgi:SpoVK/Ycf46/Vps4 family AAA+-type ATPase